MRPKTHDERKAMRNDKIKEFLVELLFATFIATGFVFTTLYAFDALFKG
jgi:hypothetical protein